MFGLYGACSTFGEALSLAAMTVHAGYAGHVIALASSHFASAEKQFRYPLEYGGHRLRHGQLQAAGQPLLVRKKARSVSVALRPEK